MGALDNRSEEVQPSGETPYGRKRPFSCVYRTHAVHLTWRVPQF